VLHRQPVLLLLLPLLLLLLLQVPHQHQQLHPLVQLLLQPPPLLPGVGLPPPHQ
jgi:hypothetical protein